MTVQELINQLTRVAHQTTPHGFDLDVIVEDEGDDLKILDVKLTTDFIKNAVSIDPIVLVRVKH